MNRQARLRARLLVVAFTMTAVCLAALADKRDTTPHRSAQAGPALPRSHGLSSTLALHQLRAELAELRVDEFNQVAHAGDQTAVANEAQIAATLQDVRQALCAYQATRPSPEQLQLSKQITHKLDAYLQLREQISQAARAGKIATAHDLSFRLAQPLGLELFADIVTLTDKLYTDRTHGRLAQQ